MLFRITFVVLLSAFASQSAYADTIPITGGTFTESTSSIADFSLTGAGVQLQGAAVDSMGVLQQCTICVPGTPLSLSGFWTVEGELETNASILPAAGTFTFTSAVVPIPDLAPNEGAAFTRAFSLPAPLRFRARACRFCSPAPALRRCGSSGTRGTGFCRH